MVLSQAEPKVLNKSWKDGKPRVVNINVDARRDDMLRVGVWDKLDDPSNIQVPTLEIWANLQIALNMLIRCLGHMT